MFQALGHGPRDWERRRRRRQGFAPTAPAAGAPRLSAAAASIGGRPGKGPAAMVLEEDAAALRRRLLLHPHSSSGLRQRHGQQRAAGDPTTLLLLSLKPPTRERGAEASGDEEEEDAGRQQPGQKHRRPSCSYHYPSSFLSTSSAAAAAATTTPAPAALPLTPSILALSAAGASADRTAKKIMSQLEQSVQKARRAFTPKRPYLADMKDPFHHFRASDLFNCVLRATLQASLLPMHRFMDDLLENIQEAERRAAIFDALDEDEVDEEDEEMLRIEMPDWRLHLRNFEWRVLVNVARSLGTKTIHYTLLDPLLAMYLSTRGMDRLTKDPFLSARRKDDRLGGRLAAALRMPKTAAYAIITLSLSNLIWDLLVLGYDLLVEARPHLRIGPKPPLLPPPSSPPGKKKRRPAGPIKRRRPFGGGASSSSSSGFSDAAVEEEDEDFVMRITGGAVSLEALAARRREREREGRERAGMELEDEEGEGGGFGHFNHASESAPAEAEEAEEAEEEEEDEATLSARRRERVRARVRQALLINGTAYAASVVFMSLGTLVYPGLGTTIGAILADCTPLLLGL